MIGTITASSTSVIGQLMMGCNICYLALLNRDSYPQKIAYLMQKANLHTHTHIC